eukprot:403338736
MQQSSRPKLLYVDALNFSRGFFKDQNFWNRRAAFSKVRKFVEAAINSGYQLEVYIDAGKQTHEAQEKWRTRREAQLRKCELNVPTCLSTLLGDMFRGNKVPVYYSDVDNDDTLAAFANYYGADILSQDKDFYRYMNRKFEIFSSYQVVNGRLILEKSQKFRHPKPRQLLDPLPNTYPYYPIVERIIVEKEYIRGCPSALTKFTGNLHYLIKPLRQVFYTKMGINFEVFECYPEWDSQNERVYWVEEYVKPAGKFLMSVYLPIFNNIRELINQFKEHLKRPDIIGEADDLAWNNHIFGFCALISELVASVHKKPMHLYMDICETYMIEMGIIKKLAYDKNRKHVHRLQVELERKRFQQELQEENERQRDLEEQRDNSESLNIITNNIENLTLNDEEQVKSNQEKVNSPNPQNQDKFQQFIQELETKSHSYDKDNETQNLKLNQSNLKNSMNQAQFQKKKHQKLPKDKEQNEQPQQSQKIYVVKGSIQTNQIENIENQEDPKKDSKVPKNNHRQKKGGGQDTIVKKYVPKQNIQAVVQEQLQQSINELTTL